MTDNFLKKLTDFMKKQQKSEQLKVTIQKKQELFQNIIILNKKIKNQK